MVKNWEKKKKRERKGFFGSVLFSQPMTSERMCLEQKQKSTKTVDFPIFSISNPRGVGSVS